MTHLIKLIGLSLLMIFGIGCQQVDTEPTSPPLATESAATPRQSALPSLPAGYTADLLPFTFNRPTQFTIEGEFLWVAQLAGGENESSGQVLRINLSSGEQVVVAEGLDKPTGLAIVDDMVWVATRDALVRIASDPPLSTPEVILQDLPNNGRSNGTLTVLPSGEILYETSGNRRDEDAGKLWALNPQTLMVREVASGLKGGYAHVVGDDGRVWFTEIVDGSLDGVPYPDEINLLSDGADYGWPNCYGREPQEGSDCEQSQPAVTVFKAGSTPTGIAISPFDEGVLFVALWVSGEVVTVNMTTGAKQLFLESLGNPQHLITTEGSLWVSDYSTGNIYRIDRLDKE